MLSEVSASLRMANAKWQDFYRKLKPLMSLLSKKLFVLLNKVITWG